MPLDRAADAPPYSDRAAGVPPPDGADPDRPPATAPGASAAPAPVRSRPSSAATIVLTIVLVGGYLLLQTAVGLLVLVPIALDLALSAEGAPTPDRLAGLLWNHAGTTAWVGIVVSTPPALAVLWWLARRQGGGSARLRLALSWPRRRDALAWLLAVLAFGWLYEKAVVWVDRPPMPPVMEQVFRSAGWGLPALVFAVVVLAPAFEELAFRGFCLGGLAPLGAVWAVGISSALFAVIHVQYDLFDVGAVLGLGLLFGAARWQTGSTLLTVGLHAFHNGLASLQALWIVGEAAP